MRSRHAVTSIAAVLALLLALAGLVGATSAQASTTEERKAAFRQDVLADAPDGTGALAIRAYEGVPLRDADIDEAIDLLLTRETGDFRLAQLVRVLHLTDAYDDRILPSLRDLPYWLTRGEDQYVHWSENHMILWMSSAYLMRQREGWAMDAELDRRLNHFLDLKLRYGFYEFLSPTYHPFTLGALLNLADFARDPVIKSKATLAAHRLMRELLLVFNDEGALYPAAGRAYTSQYASFEPRSVFWILTGKGPRRTSSDYAGGFVATSAVPLDDVGASFRDTVDTTLVQGHPQSENLRVHAGLTRVDRTLFQWSSGGYFHPDTADDTISTVREMDLEDRKEFKELGMVPDEVPEDWLNVAAKIGATYSRSSSISQLTADVYKRKGAVLTSFDRFYPGYRGYQQWPWAATVGDIAVWTQAGKVSATFGSENTSANSHLPKVQQQGNVALVTYFPNVEIRLSDEDTSVRLAWPKARFDETREAGAWVLGRKGDSYVAVYRDGAAACGEDACVSRRNDGRQLWAAVVGHRDTHGGFDAFADRIAQARVRQSYAFDLLRLRMVYTTSIDVDGTRIQQSW